MVTVSINVMVGIWAILALSRSKEASMGVSKRNRPKCGLDLLGGDAVGVAHLIEAAPS